MPPKAQADSDQAPVKRRLPTGGEFSPQQLDLRKILDLIHDHAPDREAILDAIEVTFPKLGTTRQRCANVLISMQSYGLFDAQATQLTEAGDALRLTSDDKALFEGLAKHVLAEQQGADVLQVVHDLELRKELARKASINGELRRRGFDLPPDTTNHLILLRWLEKSGVCSYTQATGWTVDDARVKELLGIALSTVDEWAALPQEQRLFLRALQHKAHVVGTDPIPVKDVRSAAESQYGVEFRANLRAKVIKPLEAEGWLKTAGMVSGKSGTVAATQKLIDLKPDLATELSTGLIPPVLRQRLNTPLTEIYEKLDSDSKNEQGIALELLALRLAYDVGLAPMGFRVRSAQTGQAEVDLIAEGAHLLFSRWLFQCKATKGSVQLHDLAKEIGLATLLHAHVVVMVTRGTFSTSLREHADKASENTALQVVLIDGKMLTRYKNSGATALLTFFHQTASDTLRLKRPQVAGIA